MSEIRIYCVVCAKFQPVLIERLQRGDAKTPYTKPRGDVMCSVCHLVIAAIETDEEGVYEIRKVVPVEEKN